MQILINFAVVLGFVAVVTAGLIARRALDHQVTPTD